MKILGLFSVVFLVGCASFFKTDIPMEEIQKNDEFEEMVKVKEVRPPVAYEEAKEVKKLPKTKEIKVAKKPPVKPKEKIAKKIVIREKKKAKVVRMPKLEDSEGFNGRRPIVDPFRVGEKVVLSLTYLNMSAGTLAFETLPFVEVNGKTAYQFKVAIKSSKMFSYFYKLDNSAETYVDYNELKPYSHAVHIKESKQVKESRSFFNWETMKASYWEKQITKKGEKKKKHNWDLKPYSQNLISTLFYLRAFTLKPGKVINYRVADAGKNHMIHVDVLKREVVKNDLGEFKTVKVKVQYKTDGAFAQAGDIYFWITDDSRKLLVKLVSKIKIGSLVGDLAVLKR